MRYHNIQLIQSYAEIQGIFPKGIMSMLKGLHIPHTGQLHSGIGYLM